jgi:hypothetical protein
VTIRKPLGKTVLAKLLALSFLRKICWN